MAKHDKLDAERNAAKLPDSKFDPKELKKGTDREMEHTESRAEAEKIAKQHLFDNPRYYSELDKAGFEEMELEEKWSAKYKRSIDCNNPKGFSQKAHCQGRKKNESEDLIDEGKNKPTNPGLWSRAKAAARSKFKVYPSAYANAWASKWYKKHGGGWRKSKKVNEAAINQLSPTSLDKEIYNTSRNPTIVAQSEKLSSQVNPAGYDTLVNRFVTSVDKFLIDPKNNQESIQDLERYARILLMNLSQTDEAEAEAILSKFKGQTQTSAMAGLSEAVLANKQTRTKLIAYLLLTLGQIGIEQIAKLPNVLPDQVASRLSTEDDGKTEDNKTMSNKKQDSVGASPLQEALDNSGILLCECDCGCSECEMSYDTFDINDEVDEEFDEYEFNTEDFGSYLGGNNKGNPDLDMDGIYSPEELYYHFDLDDDGIVIPDEYEEHVEWHADHPEILQKHKNKLAPAVSMMVKSKWR